MNFVFFVGGRMPAWAKLIELPESRMTATRLWFIQTSSSSRDLVPECSPRMQSESLIAGYMYIRKSMAWRYLVYLLLSSSNKEMNILQICDPFKPKDMPSTWENSGISHCSSLVTCKQNFISEQTDKKCLHSDSQRVTFGQSIRLKPISLSLPSQIIIIIPWNHS